MEEKVRFVLEYEQDERTMRELCEVYGIARETGYVWLRRYRERGLAGLVELNRAALRHGNQTPAETEQAVVELRQAHMRWGPRKLKRVLERDQAHQRWPAASTIGELLKREGLVVGRKRRRRTAPYTEPLAHADGPNRVWCADFKGWFRTADGERIDPLTISDAYSRYLLRCQAVEKTDTQRTRAIFEAAFREYGMPQAIRTDNGAPFASSAVGGLSRLAVWWMKLGIVPERIQAGHPEQNGRHERMHRTLKAQTSAPPAANAPEQQVRFDAFREHYNKERPHEALDQRPPATAYTDSPRAMPARVADPWYDADHQARRVRNKGEIKWKGEFVFIGEALADELVGVAERETGDHVVRFCDLDIGLIDRRGLFTRFAPLRERLRDPGEQPAQPKLSGIMPVQNVDNHAG